MVWIEYILKNFSLSVISDFLIEDIKFKGIMIIPPSQTFSIKILIKHLYRSLQSYLS